MAEKRFVETISTGIIKDNQTGIEYSCEMRIDDDFLNLVNIIAKENEQLKSELSEKDIQLDFLKDENKHMRDLVNENEQLKLQYSELEITLMNNQLAYNNLKEENEYYKSKCASLEEGYLKLQRENDQLKSDLEYYRETYSIQEYGLDTETHVQLSSPILSRKELLKENEQLYELINFANTLIAFKTSESCQKEWEKRLKELKE